MDDDVSTQGYFSLLRWRLDSTRDEARNVAVLLVDREGTFAGVKAAPISSISPRLHEQGILDSVIFELEAQFSAEDKPRLKLLEELHNSMQHSLYLTEPRPTAVTDVDAVLSALYRAYVAPRSGGSRVLTKGRLLDGVVNEIRRRGFNVHRGTYVRDFLFDAIVEGRGRRAVLEVLSFATAAQNWAPVEHDAGHFLYALDQVDAAGVAVIKPPSEISHQNASKAYERVGRWLRKANVKRVTPENLGREFPREAEQGRLSSLA